MVFFGIYYRNCPLINIAMERWICCFLLGVFSSLLWPELPSVYLITLLVFSVLLLWRIKLKNFAAIMLGIAWIGSVGQWFSQWQLPSQDISEKIFVTGHVTNLIDFSQDNDFVRFNFSVSQFKDNRFFLFKPNLRLTWRHPEALLQQGQKLEMLVKLKPANGLRNQGGFDYQKWLMTEKIQATGYVVSDASNLIVDDSVAWRQQVFNKINLLTDDFEHQRYLLALLLGYRGDLERTDWRLLQQTGTSHLIAISGLHLGLISLFALVAIRTLSSVVLMLVRTAHFNRFWFELIASILLVIGYAWLAGFSLPTLRALIVTLILFVVLMVGSRWSLISAFLACLFAVSLLSPLSIYTSSFWLSFSAVGIIVFLLWRYRWTAPQSKNKLKWIKPFLLFQLALSTLMIPVSAIFFNELSLLSPLANLIAVPLIGFIVLPLCLLATISSFVSIDLSILIFKFADFFLSVYTNWLTVLTALQPEPFVLKHIPVIAWFLFIGFVLMNMLPLHKNQRVISLLLLAPLISHASNLPKPFWRIDVLDVGQGLSVVVQKNNRAIVYDVGAAYPTGFNMADSAVTPFLRHQGIRQVDKLFISHKDNDHAGSLEYFLLQFEVSQVYFNQGEHNPCLATNEALVWQSLKIEFLHPLKADYSSENNNSCVIKISDQKFSVLLAGDIEKSVEQTLATSQINLQSSLLIAPHHGSATSSSVQFIEAVQPEFTVFSSGFYNHWGFPRQEVVERYYQKKIKTFNTAEKGQISFIVKDDIEVKTFADDWSPHWYRFFGQR